MSAAEELRKLMELTGVKEELGKRGLSWQFIPKRAPWFRLGEACRINKDGYQEGFRMKACFSPNP